MPLHQTPQDLGPAIASLRELAAESGRRVSVSAGCRFRFADEPGGEDTLIGPPDLLIERLRRFADVGVDEFHLLNGGYRSVADLADAWERFGSEVVPMV